MTVTSLTIARIAVRNRIRPVDADFVRFLAASLEERGLDIPVCVRPIAQDDEFDYELVAGLHRLTAATQLGWIVVDADVVDLTADEARFREIEENLVRRELSVIDRAVSIAEWADVFYRLRGGVPGHGGDRRSKLFSLLCPDDQGQPLPLKSFSEEAAERIGLSARSVRQAQAIGRKLQRDTLDQLRGTRFENATRLLSSLTNEGEHQAAIARLLREGRAATVDEAKTSLGIAERRLAPPDPDFKALMGAWRVASADARDRFLATLRETGDLA